MDTIISSILNLSDASDSLDAICDLSLQLHIANALGAEKCLVRAAKESQSDRQRNIAIIALGYLGRCQDGLSYKTAQYLHSMIDTDRWNETSICSAAAVVDALSFNSSSRYNFLACDICRLLNTHAPATPRWLASMATLASQHYSLMLQAEHAGDLYVVNDNEADVFAGLIYVNSNIPRSVRLRHLARVLRFFGLFTVVSPPNRIVDYFEYYTPRHQGVSVRMCIRLHWTTRRNRYILHECKLA